MLFTAFLLFITGCHIILHRPVCYQQSRILRTQPKSSYLYLYYIWYRIFYNQPKTSVNILFFYIFFQVLWLPKEDRQIISCRLRLKYDGSRVETRFRLLAKRRSPFKSAGASVQSTTGSRGVRISGSNARYTMFRGSVKSTDYPLHSPVPHSLPLPRVTVFHHISTGLYFGVYSRALWFVCFEARRRETLYAPKENSSLEVCYLTWGPEVAHSVKWLGCLLEDTWMHLMTGETDFSFQQGQRFFCWQCWYWLWGLSIYLYIWYQQLLLEG